MKIKLTLLMIALLAGQAVMYGQEHNERYGNSYYRFESQSTGTQDSVPALYCVITLRPLRDFQKIALSYNGKQDTYLLSDLLKGKAENVVAHGDKIYIRIAEKLKLPYVVVTATANNGKQYSIWQKDARGRVIDPERGMVKWKRATARLHALDLKRNAENTHRPGH